MFGNQSRIYSSEISSGASRARTGGVKIITLFLFVDIFDGSNSLLIPCEWSPWIYLYAFYY